MNAKDYMLREIEERRYSFVGASWRARLEELREAMRTRHPDTLLTWDVVKKTMLVTTSTETLHKQIDLLLCCGVNVFALHRSGGSIFEFGAGFGAHYHWHSVTHRGNYFIHDLPDLIALQRLYLETMNVDRLPVFLSDLEAFLSAMHDNTSRASLFMALWSLSEAPISIRRLVLDVAIERCEYIMLAYQPVYDLIDNTAFFHDYFKEHAGAFVWTTLDAKPLDGTYLIARRKAE